MLRTAGQSEGLEGAWSARLPRATARTSERLWRLLTRQLLGEGGEGESYYIEGGGRERERKKERGGRGENVI